MKQVTDVLPTIGDGLIFVSAVLAVASVALHLRVPWWRTEMGRHLLAYALVIAAVLTLSSVRVIFGDSPWLATLRVVVFAGVPLVMAWRVWLQVKARRQPRQDGDTP